MVEAAGGAHLSRLPTRALPGRSNGPQYHVRSATRGLVCRFSEDSTEPDTEAEDFYAILGVVRCYRIVKMIVLNFKA